MHRILAQFTIVALFCGFLVTATPIDVGRLRQIRRRQRGRARRQHLRDATQRPLPQRPAARRLPKGRQRQRQQQNPPSPPLARRPAAMSPSIRTPDQRRAGRRCRSRSLASSARWAPRCCQPSPLAATRRRHARRSPSRSWRRRTPSPASPPRTQRALLMSR